ncbi:hypothetical protein [Granulosicoccus antarcticus]|uniref:Uncharacterized protein n=1 Tax=Granulosicoccus antarcticus IMCC3135 TaxID=1192854 RepID=A0A2Z2NZ04_9GAMM|nr:hypothetical protein [Granulosicoccus antarcticus]ASJ72364.1 hypothetical protein IMCC3135_11370 [Granulosicoccus antarcticus IMCC3135]
MMRQWTLLVLFMGMSLCGAAHADLKVLLTFDSSGVKVNRVVEIADSGENYLASLAELADAAPVNMVIMKWLGADGQPLAITRIADPRVASSPEHMNPSVRSRVGLNGGAWVCDGPDGTESIIIDFPENAALGLVAETWPVSLH